MEAPVKIPVEVRLSGTDKRAFRLSERIGPERLWLARDLPFEEGRQGDARFVLPGEREAIVATVEIHPQELLLISIHADDRARIVAYVKHRLGHA